MLVRTAAILTLAVFFTIPICAHGADAPLSVEEVELRSVVIETCHPVLTDDDRAFVKVVVETVQAEAKRIWTQLVETTISNYDERLRRTDDILMERLVRTRETAKMKVTELGCAALDVAPKPAAH